HDDRTTLTRAPRSFGGSGGVPRTRREQIKRRNTYMNWAAECARHLRSMRKHTLKHRPRLAFGQTHPEHQSHHVRMRLFARDGALGDKALELGIIEEALEYVIADQLPGGRAHALSRRRCCRRGTHRHASTDNMLTPCR